MCPAPDTSDPRFEACRRLAAQLWAVAGSSSNHSSSGSSSSSKNSISSGATFGSSSVSTDPLLHSVWVNYRRPGAVAGGEGEGPTGPGGSGSSANSIVGGGWEHVAGPQDAWQRFGRALVCLGPGVCGGGGGRGMGQRVAVGS